MQLTELLIAITIMAALSAIAIPNYHQMKETRLLHGVSDQLQNQIELAKTVSLTRNTTIYLCATQNQQNCNEDWKGQLAVYTSPDPKHIGQIIKASKPLSPEVSIRFQAFNNNEYLSFNPSAELNYNGSFYLDTAHKSMRLTVSKTGIVSTTP